MTAQDADAAKSDILYLARTEYFMVVAAINVIAEVTTVAQHAERLTLARRILGDPAAYAPRFALASLTNATLFAANSLAEISDSDLQFAINSVFASFLGL